MMAHKDDGEVSPGPWGFVYQGGGWVTDSSLARAIKPKETTAMK